MVNSGAGNAAYRDGLQLFALGSTRPLGQRVADHLGVPLAGHEEREFEDGEHKARPMERVRGNDVYVFHSLYGEPGQSGNDKLCRLLFFIGALKDAGAARVTAVAPYLAYARKDRKSQPRDPVTTRYVAAMFEAVGADVAATVDVHNLSAFQNAFRCRTEHIEAVTLFVEHFAPLVQDRDVVVVSPDAGGIKRAERFRLLLSETLGRPVGSAFMEKYRSLGVVTGDTLVGDLKNRTAIIIDDLISTGTTLARAAQACESHGAEAVHAVATHGLFTRDAENVLGKSLLTRIVICDTVPPFRVQGHALQERLDVLDTGKLLAAAVLRMHSGEDLPSGQEG